MTNRTYRPRPQQQPLFAAYSSFLSGKGVTDCQQDQYLRLLAEVTHILGEDIWSKHLRIRIQAWLDRLHREHVGELEGQNRTNYLKLLHLMLESRHLIPPFHAFPPTTTLPILDKHTYHATIAQTERAIKLRKGMSGNPPQYVSTQYVSTGTSHPSSQAGDKSLGSTVPRGKPTTAKNDQPSKTSAQKFSFYEEADAIPSKLKLRGKEGENCEDKGEGLRKKSRRPDQSNSSRMAVMMPVDLNQEVSGNQTNKLQVHKWQSGGARPTTIKNVGSRVHSYFKAHPLFQSKSQSTVGSKQIKAKVSATLSLDEDDRMQDDLPLQPLNLGSVDLRYWQSNSVAENGTPKYLSAFASNSYASLVLSEEDGLLTNRSIQTPNCHCLRLFLGSKPS